MKRFDSEHEILDAPILIEFESMLQLIEYELTMQERE